MLLMAASRSSSNSAALCWAVRPSVSAREKLVETGHRLHQLYAVGLVLQAFVDLEERHNLLDVPQVVGGAAALDLAVHRHLEEDRPEHPVPVEARTGDDARAHLVDAVE